MRGERGERERKRERKKERHMKRERDRERDRDRKMNHLVILVEDGNNEGAEDIVRDFFNHVLSKRSRFIDPVRSNEKHGTFE